MNYRADRVRKYVDRGQVSEGDNAEAILVGARADRLMLKTYQNYLVDRATRLIGGHADYVADGGIEFASPKSNKVVYGAAEVALGVEADYARQVRDLSASIILERGERDVDDNSDDE